MTDSNNSPPDTKGQLSETASETNGAPEQMPMNLVTPVTIHDSWEGTYEDLDSKDSDTVDYKETADGNIVLTSRSFDIIRKKLKAGKMLKDRHKKVLKAHEELMEQYESLAQSINNPPKPKMEIVPKKASGSNEDIEKAIQRMEKITRALAACKWHEIKRRARLVVAMRKTLAYLKKKTLA